MRCRKGWCRDLGSSRQIDCERHRKEVVEAGPREVVYGSDLVVETVSSSRGEEPGRNLAREMDAQVREDWMRDLLLPGLSLP